jgi:hypothetical protein
MSEEYASEDEYAVTDDAEGNFSVDDLYMREAAVTTGLLMETVEKLYTPVAPAAPTGEVADELVRPPTYGYAAHVDKVGDGEVGSWQRCFPYLAVVGVGIQIADLQTFSCVGSSGDVVEEEILAQDGLAMV